MKSKFQRLIMCTIICITILNMLTSLISSTATTVQADTTVVNELDTEANDQSFASIIGGFFGTAIDGVVGIISKVIQIPLLLIGMSIEGLLTGIAKLGDNSIEGFLTPDDIFFNRVGLTKINFFEINNGDSVIATIRKNIATWYYILRVMSTVILLAVLIYIGIRMAISTVASEQAQYKRMLKDWAVSFALLFLLNYIIMFTIEANNALVNMLSGPARATIGKGVMAQLTELVVGPTSILEWLQKIFTGDAGWLLATQSWAALIVYFMIIGMTMAFLFMYVKRMLTVGFLIIISPLITITYSIDKVKDGRAQALDTWLKEFMFTVLIQPFHCIIYLAFISTTINTMSTGGASLAKLVLAVMCMKFVWTAEGIVKKIFGFHEASSFGEGLAAWATVKQLGNTVRKATGTASKAVSKTGFGKNIASKAQNNPGFQKVSQKLQNFQDSKVGGAITSIAKNSMAGGIGLAAASFEMGANTKANAMQVGLEAYGIAHDSMFAGEKDKDDAKKLQNDVRKCADQLARNNTYNFGGYTGNQTAKNDLKAFAQSLIGVNMDHLNNSIQTALNALVAESGNAGSTISGEYDLSTKRGQENILKLQDMAKDDSLDFNVNNPVTGIAWTAQEKAVVSAIQKKDFAQAVNGLYTTQQNLGRNNPAQDVDDYIESLT